MSTLLIDIGNTRIKWAGLSPGGVLQKQRAAIYEGWNTADAGQIVFSKLRAVERIVAVSVAPDSINQAIREAAAARGIESFTFVESARSLGGVTTRYTEAWRLGTDRLVAMIGAFAMVGKRGACVIDVGTAMTLDVVDSKGVHLGGVIVPGPQLMIASLLKQTNGIWKRARAGGGAASASTAEHSRGAGFFARSTKDAVAAGSRFAAAAAIDRAVLEAKARLGRAPLVLLTGGAAPLVRPLLRTRGVQDVPDLVLRGLAELAKTPLR